MAEEITDVNTLERKLHEQKILQQKLASFNEKAKSLGQKSVRDVEVTDYRNTGERETTQCERQEQEEGLMTANHKQILRRNRATLVENMIPDDLFRYLVSRNTVTPAEERRMKTCAAWEDINTKLLECISTRSDSAFTYLEEALRDTCQEHLADLLLGHHGKRDHVEEVMTPENKQAINRNRHQLATDITADDIFNDMIAEKILSSSEVSRIKEKGPREDTNECLLNYIVRRCDRAFEVFVESLKKTGQEHLAKMLSGPHPRLEQKRKKLKPLSIPVSDQSGEESPTSSFLPTYQTPAYISQSDQLSQPFTLSVATAAIGQSTPSDKQSSISSIQISSSNQNPSHKSNNSLAFHESPLVEDIFVPSSQIPSLPQFQNQDTELSANPNPVTCLSGSCTLDDVKQQIMFMAENAYANVRRKDDSGEAFHQFSKEMSQTTQSINDSLKVFTMIKEFCEDTDVDTEGQGQRDEAVGCHDNQSVPDI